MHFHPMTATRVPASLPVNPIHQGGAPRAAGGKVAGATEADPRQLLLHEATELNDKARASAERGELATAARLILQALDCERRAVGLGPQVLQLIKPRV